MAPAGVGRALRFQRARPGTLCPVELPAVAAAALVGRRRHDAVPIPRGLIGDEGRVVAFEPGAASFAALEKSQALNRATNVILVRKALADREGRAHLYHHLAQANSFSIAPPEGACDFEEIEITTLPRALAENNVTRLDFIKLDIDGAEELVLRAASELLARHHPVILFEPHPEGTRRLGLQPDGTTRFLGELGYEIYSLDARGALQRADDTIAAKRWVALTSCATFPSVHR